MITLLAIAVFVGGLAAASYALFATVVPNLARIGEALTGRPHFGLAPLEQLVRAERRIAVRRWAGSAPVRAPAPRRAAA